MMSWVKPRLPLLFAELPVELPYHTHQEHVIELLRLYAKAGASLAHVAKPHIANRSLRTLKHYCILGDVAFPDYVPRHMRPKAVKKKRRRRKVKSR